MSTPENSGGGETPDAAKVVPENEDKEGQIRGEIRRIETPDTPPPSPATPVFYNENRRRWHWFLRGAMTGLFLILVGAILLTVSLIALPLMPRSPLPKVSAVREFANPEPALTDHENRQMGVKQTRELTRLQELEEERRQRQRTRRAEALIRASLAAHAEAAGALQPVVAGFYVSWEETSQASTRRNIGSLTHFIPEWLHLKPAGYPYADPKGNPFTDARQPLDLSEVEPFVKNHGVPIIPLINNYTRTGGEEGEGKWDTEAVHQIVSNPKTRANVIALLRDWLLKEQMQGINLDFEQIAETDRDNLTQFIQELSIAFHAHKLLVTQDVELESDALDLPKLAKWNDWIVPMFYDEHETSSEPGPVASIDWTRSHLNQMLTQIPAGKIVMGVGNHAYDWTKGQNGAAGLTYQSAILLAKESQPDAVVKLDPASLNPTFTYSEDAANGSSEHEEQHTVWMQDAVSVYNQLRIAKPQGVRGAALWYLGAEDPSIWQFFSRNNWKADWDKAVASGALNQIKYTGEGEIDFEGEGEILQPRAEPSQGLRTVTRDPKTGLITAETYQKDAAGKVMFPSGYVVRRYGGGLGNPKKRIVLTFDDGPDPTWTPQILDILKKYGVHATFFVVGKQAEEYPDLVRRMWDEGHEIGNHSWSHPDLYKLTPEAQHLQVTTTQRVIQAITGRSTTLFRPPYGGDPEPTTGQEVAPMVTAADMNYLTIGEKNDPQDWRLYENKPGTEAQDITRPRIPDEIVKSVVVNRDEGSIVLLHDAGGNRENTLIALPQIITQLRALGYTFENVSDLRGLSRDTLMPPVTGNDVYLAGADRYVFLVSYIVQRTLTTLFTLSILLGISRVVLFVGLALIQRYRERRRTYAEGFTPAVSVIIAAYNEEKVIAQTVTALLASDYPNLQVIVVDDGSKDNTAGVVQKQFANEPRVTVIRKENGGKASALNRGILEATGELLVSLDADTLFDHETIWRLARHFVNPKVGAVSGNVRVGNTHNLLTRWQALEYITSQNFDRRGYDLLNCITVVPGAVGALRREAVLSVGGYTSDTLAEDTDLTWKLRRSGWRIVNDNSAMAYTEAPETLRNLAKQRFRWAFGTLQCLWKHRAAMGQHGAFGWLALPSLWLYQILFPAISPFMDIAMVYSVFAGNFRQFATYFLIMFGIEFVAAAIAIRMDKGNPRLLPWLFLQRFVYRQLMYYVILKSLLAAIRGGAVGWNKLERTGSARIEGKAA